MKIYLATDHAGFPLKEQVKAFLLSEGYEVEDKGAMQYDSNDDYPDYIALAAKAITEHPEDRAIIFGGSGQAEMIVANKFPNVRAVLFYGPIHPVAAADVTGRQSDDPYEIIRLTREHNNANILSIGARFVTEDQVKRAVKIWLETSFSGDERHMRRIEKIRKLEKNNFKFEI